MKNKRLIIISFVVTVLIAILSFTVVFAAGSVEKSGKTFASEDSYSSMQPIAAAPRTFEAVIKVNENAAAGRLGIIAGNYRDGATSSMSVNFEIRGGGKPSVWWCLPGKAAQTITFDGVDIRTGSTIHLAITVSETEAKCYVDGVLKSTKTGNFETPDTSTLSNIKIGGDFRSGNAQYLKDSELYNVKLFSNVRSEEQIKNDMNLGDSTDGLLMWYDMTADGKEILRDLSENENHLMYVNSADSSKNESLIEDDETKEGMNFTTETLYMMNDAIDGLPYSVEAEIYFSKYTPEGERGGVLLGNYGDEKRCVNYEIYSGGSPRIYWVDSSGKVVDTVFRDVNVYRGEWIRLSLVVDTKTNKAYCYINGELEQSISVTGISNKSCASEFCIGGDHRSGNEQCFKGRIKSLAVYSDARTSSEIQNPSDSGDEDLIAMYKFESVENGNYPDSIKDISNSGNDIKYTKMWIDSVDSDFDYEYSFAVVGDTQIIALNHPNEFSKIYDYIVDNIEAKKIKAVLGLGDITDANSKAEWEVARENISKLNGKVAYSLARGNHDGVENFRSNLLAINYDKVIDGYMGSMLENSWQELVVGDIKYLILTLDYGPSDKVIEWASEIIEDHPEHNVIITTHAYLYRDGTTLDAGDVCPPKTSGGYNNGDDLWNKLISKHENIVLVLSGHDPCDDIVMTKTKGKNGNTVTQMLIDPQGVDKAQGATGMVAMLYFSEDGSNVRVEYYSTVKEKYLMEKNQFEFEIDVVSADQKDPINPPLTTQGAPSVTSSPITTQGIPSGTSNPVTTQSAPATTSQNSDNSEKQPEKASPILVIVLIAAVVTGVAVAAFVPVIKRKMDDKK